MTWSTDTWANVSRVTLDQASDFTWFNWLKASQTNSSFNPHLYCICYYTPLPSFMSRCTFYFRHEIAPEERLLVQWVESALHFESSRQMRTVATNWTRKSATLATRTSASVRVTRSIALIPAETTTIGQVDSWIKSAGRGSVLCVH